MARPEQRSADADEVRAWYGLAIWKDPDTGLRAQQLRREPRCERHLRRGEIVEATVVNHRRAVRSGKTREERWALFIDPRNHESTCKPCHDGEIQSQERSRFVIVGVDGWPTEDG